MVVTIAAAGQTNIKTGGSYRTPTLWARRHWAFTPDEFLHRAVPSHRLGAGRYEKRWGKGHVVRISRTRLLAGQLV